MKKNLISVISFLFISLSIFSQSLPPAGIRGTYVDCAQDLIFQIHQGNPTPTLNLLDDMRNKNITYVALFGLDHNQNSTDFPNGYVIGDANFEPDIFYFVSQAHARNIKVGVVISDKNFVEHTFTPRIDWHKIAVRSDCFPPDAMRIADVDGNDEGKKLFIGELSKAAVRVANYNSISAYFGGYVDYLSVEYEYWTNSFYTDHPSYVDDATYSKEYYAYQDLLVLLNFVRNNVICSGKYSSLRSEMELRIKSYSSGLITVPSPQIQADQIDLTLIDRILLVDYHRNIYALFGYNCDNLYWLGRPSGRGRTEILNLLSAESSSFLKYVCTNYPNNGLYWDDFLGDFLNTSPNTMADAESKWYSDLISSTGSSCTNCGCTFNNGDNEIKGFMWFTSSILTDHSFNRSSKPDHSFGNLALYKYFKGTNIIRIDNFELFNAVSIFDFGGLLIFSGDVNKQEINIPSLLDGIYLLKFTDKLNNVTTTKFVVQ